jgi:hypothetical protein
MFGCGVDGCARALAVAGVCCVYVVVESIFCGALGVPGSLLHCVEGGGYCFTLYSRGSRLVPDSSRLVFFLIYVLVGRDMWVSMFPRIDEDDVVVVK